MRVIMRMSHICMFVYVCMCMYTDVSTCLCVNVRSMSVRMRVCMYINHCVYKLNNTYICIFMYTCVGQHCLEQMNFEQL